MTQTEIIDRIKQLKKEKNAIILAHYYTRPEVQDIADYLGDSLGLSQMAGNSIHHLSQQESINSCGRSRLLLSRRRKRI